MALYLGRTDKCNFPIFFLTDPSALLILRKHTFTQPRLTDAFRFQGPIWFLSGGKAVFTSKSLKNDSSGVYRVWRCSVGYYLAMQYYCYKKQMKWKASTRVHHLRGTVSWRWLCVVAHFSGLCRSLPANFPNCIDLHQIRQFTSTDAGNNREKSPQDYHEKLRS